MQLASLHYFEVALDEPGVAYFAVLPASAPAPTTAEIRKLAAEAAAAAADAADAAAAAAAEAAATAAASSPTGSSSAKAVAVAAGSLRLRATGVPARIRASGLTAGTTTSTAHLERRV